MTVERKRKVAVAGTGQQGQLAIPGKEALSGCVQYAKDHESNLLTRHKSECNFELPAILEFPRPFQDATPNLRANSQVMGSLRGLPIKSKRCGGIVRLNVIADAVAVASGVRRGFTASLTSLEVLSDSLPDAPENRTDG